MWIRAVTVKVTSDNNSMNATYGYQSGMQGPSHRIDFEYKSSIGWGSDYGTITIYNLDYKEQGSFVKAQGKLNITLYAGYKDGLSIIENENYPVPPGIFVGSITNVVTFKSGTESITQLYCVPASSLSVTRLCNIDSIKKGSSLKKALTQLTIGCGLSLKLTGIPESLLGRPFKRGRAFNKTYRDELKSLCEENNLSFRLAPTFVEFFPASMNNDSIGRMMNETGLITIKPENVIGTGVSGISSLELSLTLNAVIQPGMLIDVSNLVPRFNNVDYNNSTSGYLGFNQEYEAQLNTTTIAILSYNVYQIKDIVHHGSTHGDTFQTDIMAKVSPDSLMGVKEHEWRDWSTRVIEAV